MSTRRSKTGPDDPTAASRADQIVAAPRQAPAERLPCIIEDDEPMGGDPPCWAHLFEDEDEDEAPPADR